jgi:hypothetical protein
MIVAGRAAARLNANEQGLSASLLLGRTFTVSNL